MMRLFDLFERKERSRFGAYHVSRIVHTGDKSLVFAAASASLAEACRVAIKLYRPAYDRLAARLEKKYGIPSEADVGLILNPPPGVHARDYPIVRTIGEGREYGRRTGARYVMQEFVDGRSLKRLVVCRDGVVDTHVGSIVLQLCRALSICHRKNFVFRDLCADNVMVDQMGRVTLIDLGFATPPGIAFAERSGTPTYMSPEQVLAQPLGFTTDLYSLGVVIYEMLVGRPPYVSELSEDERAARRRLAQIMRMHVEEPVPAIADAVRSRAPALADAVIRCLQKRPEDRFQSIEEMIAALV
jgi:serine/threonine protein kinase